MAGAMDDAALVSLLRRDLQRTGELPGDPEYLPFLLESARANLARQGIRDDGTMDYAQTVIGTAAWIYRKRINGEAEPAYLRRMRLDLLLGRGRGDGG